MRSPFELKSLVEWLERQPAETEYDYTNPHNCLLCQYMRHTGFGDVLVSPWAWGGIDGERHPLPAGFNAISKARSRYGVHTFGAALNRARALLRTETGSRAP